MNDPTPDGFRLPPGLARLLSLLSDPRMGPTRMSVRCPQLTVTVGPYTVKIDGLAVDKDEQPPARKKGGVA